MVFCKIILQWCNLEESKSKRSICQLSVIDGGYVDRREARGVHLNPTNLLDPPYGRNVAGYEPIVHKNQRQLRGRQLHKIDSNRKICALLSRWSRFTSTIRFPLCIARSTIALSYVDNTFPGSFALSKFNTIRKRKCVYCAVCSPAYF